MLTSLKNWVIQNHDNQKNINLFVFRNEWAIKRLTTKNREQPKSQYNCMLKQESGNLYAYTLVLLAASNAQPRSIGITRLQEGQYQVIFYALYNNSVGGKISRSF